MGVLEIIKNFNLICEIEQITNESGYVLEYEPYKEYKNPENKKIHRFGKGPFCQFRIPINIK